MIIIEADTCHYVFVSLLVASGENVCRMQKQFAAILNSPVAPTNMLHIPHE